MDQTKNNRKSPIDPSPKQRILNKASELFYFQGFNATGINQIILESKTAKASFYDHFPSKEDLGKKVIHRYAVEILLWFRAILKSSDSPEAFLDNLEKAILLQTKSKEEIYQGCPIALFSAQFPKDDSKFSNQFEDAVKSWEKLFLAFFKKMKEKKRIASNFNSIGLTRDWINIYEGCLITWRMSNNKSYIKSMKPTMLTIYKSYKE